MKKRAVCILFVFLLVAGCSEEPEVPEEVREALEEIAKHSESISSKKRLSESDDKEWRTVKRIISGDTLELENGEKVRLIGVDTPETKHPNKLVERFGKEASEFTRNTIEGKQVWLEYDQTKKDRYGRTLAYVHYKNTKRLDVSPPSHRRNGDKEFITVEVDFVINEVIIRQGYGHAYNNYPFKYMEKYRELERKAREEKRGLWADEGIPPKGTSINDAHAKSLNLSPKPSTTVYITRTGKTYHREG